MNAKVQNVTYFRGNALQVTLVDADTNRTTTISLDERAFGFEELVSSQNLVARLAADICVAVNAFSANGSIIEDSGA